ncbi:MAG: FtsX-like permease family protein [Butyrivibrio sp.]|nr:FtsX-like permease family protein [Butyrivibrio sp.]
MFFRMLKKDITDKKGLNLILLLFMCFSSVLTVSSAVMLYANTVGFKKNNEKVNAAEEKIITTRSFGDTSDKQEATINWFRNRKEVVDIECVDAIKFMCDAVDYSECDESSDEVFANGIYYYAFDFSSEHDRVTDYDSNFFDLPCGTIAIPECIGRNANVNIGDTVRITTQMGNIYEFKVAVITKDPAMEGSNRLIFNNKDFEVLKNDSPVINSFYMIDLVDEATLNDTLNLANDFCEAGDKGVVEKFVEFCVAATIYRNEITPIVINIFMIIFSVLSVIMEFLSISFTIKTAIKSEEKELGIIKALGVDSASFNLLFATKYVVISLIAAVVGFFGGIVHAEYVLKNFAYGQLRPEFGQIIGYALAAAFMGLLIIFIFVVIALRKLGKISIRDAISGENRGESYKKAKGPKLYKIKNKNIPFYLAFTDLIKRFKQYRFLLFAYMIGISIVLAVLEILNTVHSPYWVERVWSEPEYDFRMTLPDEVMEEYRARGGGSKGAYELINEELAEANIPAKLCYEMASAGTVIYNGDNYAFCNFFYDRSYDDEVELYEGVRPVLRNEVVIDTFSSKRLGIKVGDSIRMKYPKYNEDGLSYSYMIEDFIVTGFRDITSRDALFVYMSDEFTGAYGDVSDVHGIIDAPKKMHAEYVEQMRAIYGNNSIRTMKEDLDYQNTTYDSFFVLCKWGFIPLIVGMMIMLTVLYQFVNILEELPEIAFLKSCGFSNGSIKAWQVSRSVLISVLSSVLAIICLNTVTFVFHRKLFEMMGLIMAYEPQRKVFAYYICIPVVITIVLAAVVYMTLGKVEKAELSQLRNDL